LVYRLIFLGSPVKDTNQRIVHRLLEGAAIDYQFIVKNQNGRLSGSQMRQIVVAAFS